MAVESSTCTIGRIGLATSGGGDGATTLYEPTEITQSGSSLALSGIQTESTVIKLMWLRDEFLGLADPASDQVIPCTFASYTHLDGFYRINSVAADRTGGGLAWSLDLTRLADWAHPRIEQLATYALVSNLHSVTGGSYIVAAPGVADSYFTIGTTATRANADGFTQTVGFDTGIAGPSTATRYGQVQPANWYKGCCRAEHNVASGGTYYTAVGRRSFSTNTDVARLRLQNGLVRVTCGANTVTAEWWDGSVWDTAESLVISDVTFGNVTISGASILRNVPEEVVVRLAVYFAGFSNYPAFVDVGIRRGSRMVTIYASGYGGTQWRATINGGAAYTAVTGGLRETSNNAAGNRTILVSNNSATITAASRRVNQTSTSVGDALFGFTTELGGSGASGVDDDLVAQAELFVAMAETIMIVAL